MSRLWLGAAFVLLLFPLRYWLSIPAGYRWFVPKTPLDGTAPDAAEAWMFLWNARDVVPAGASFTVVARDPNKEMALFMMSLAVLSGREARPTSYYSFPEPVEGARAEYVLAFGCPPPAEPGVAVVARVGGGCVYRRPRGRR